MYMDVVHRDFLLALAAMPIQRFEQCGVGTGQFVRLGKVLAPPADETGCALKSGRMQRLALPQLAYPWACSVAAPARPAEIGQPLRACRPAPVPSFCPCSTSRDYSRPKGYRTQRPLSWR